MSENPTLAEIEAAAESLSINDQHMLLTWLRGKLDPTLANRDEARQRVAGLHEGAWTVADDFDAPLSDDFWLGDNR